MNDRRNSVRVIPPLLVLGLVSGCGGAGHEPVEIRFAAEVAGSPARCGERYEGVGARGGVVELADARLYVSNLELHREDGTTVPVDLEQESPWQHGGVALLDFEDGSGRCSDSGTAQTNAVVRGFAAQGEYSGLSFEIGVPNELNHLDALSAPSPLNLNALYWNWRMGYIFTKIDFWNAQPSSAGEGSAAGKPEVDGTGTAGTSEEQAPDEQIPVLPGQAPTVAYLAHIGSTGCESPAPTMPPQEPCSRPNRARIMLDGFNPATDEVRLDLAGFVDGIDITHSVLRPPGCMSAPSDPDCRQVFANLGLDLATGRCFTDCSDQKLASKRPGATE